MLADSADHESAFCSEGSTTLKKDGNLPVNDSLFLTGNEYGVDIKFLVDTGATLSVLHPEKYYTIPIKHRPTLGPYELNLCMGDGALRSTLGCSVIPLVFNGQLLPQKMVIADINVSGVLGYDFFYENAVSTMSEMVPLPLMGAKCNVDLKANSSPCFALPWAKR